MVYLSQQIIRLEAKDRLFPHSARAIRQPFPGQGEVDLAPIVQNGRIGVDGHHFGNKESYGKVGGLSAPPGTRYLPGIRPATVLEPAWLPAS